jgi:hypothetical protein
LYHGALCGGFGLRRWHQFNQARPLLLRLLFECLGLLFERRGPVAQDCGTWRFWEGQRIGIHASAAAALLHNKMHTALQFAQTGQKRRAFVVDTLGLLAQVLRLSAPFSGLGLQQK